MKPSISIIMPCHNRAVFLERVLRAYDQQLGDTSFEIIAVDDGSTDSTPQLLSQYRPQRYTLRPLILERNAGPANARNRGIELAESQLTMFVGDDILPSAEFVHQHMEAHGRYTAEQYAVLGKTIWPSDLPINTLMKHIDGPGAQQFSYHYLSHEQELDFRHLYTSNISLKTSLIKKAHPWFDTRYQYAAYEDVDFGYQLEKYHGMRIVYSERPMAYHYHYHTIWTFSERQYRCGLMAAVFMHKYPHLRKRWGFGGIRLYSLISLLPGISKIINGPCADLAMEVEELALHFCSYYEEIESPLLDGLYLLVLSYFLSKGMIYGDLSDKMAHRAHKTLLLVSMHFWLREQMRLFEADNSLYPYDVFLALNILSKRLDLPEVRRVKRMWQLPIFHRLRGLFRATF